jgi:hypothetical protein
MSSPIVVVKGKGEQHSHFEHGRLPHTTPGRIPVKCSSECLPLVQACSKLQINIRARSLGDLPV